MKQLILILLILGSYSFAFTQVSLSGKITEADTNEPVLFCNVALFKEGVLITGRETDFDGNYHFKILDPGTYDVEVSYLGLQTQRISNVVIQAGKNTILNIQLETEYLNLEEIIVADYTVRLIELDNTCSGSTITSNQIRRIPNRSVTIRTNKRNKKCKKKKHQISEPKGNQQLNTESYNPLVENKFESPKHNPLSTFSIDVDNAAYSNIRRYINNNTLPPKDAVRTEEMLNYFNYDYAKPKDEHPFAVHTEVGECPWNEDNLLVHIGLQGKSIDLEDAAPNNLVFLIDVSGSMSSNNKLPLLKRAFKLLVKNLRDQDRVAMVVYAGAAGLVLPSTAGSDKNTILEVLDNLQSGGSTAGGAGINLAYKIAKENFLTEGNNRVILATDGDFNVGASSDEAMEKLIESKRKENIFLSVLGFGMGNYKDSKLELLADKGNGNYAYIDNIREAKKVFVTNLMGTLYTIAKDVKLQLEFNPKNVASYRLIGYENRLLQDEDFNDDIKDAGELGAGHTVTALYEVVPKKAKQANTNTNIDPLRYQEKKLKRTKALANELLNLKLRYKHPKASKSQLLSRIVINEYKTMSNTSDNFRFSAAVTGFSLLLRQSEYAGNWTYAKTIDFVKNAMGKDKYGYRHEFLKLVENCELLDATSAISPNDN